MTDPTSVYVTHETGQFHNIAGNDTLLHLYMSLEV